MPGGLSDQNPCQPSLDRRPALEGSQSTKSTRESLLHYILRIRRMAAQSNGQGKQSWRMPIHELVKGRMIARSSLIDELQIRGLPTVAFCRHTAPRCMYV